MSLSRQDVEKVSLLGRLRLSDQELETMTTQLGRVLGYIEQLNELNTDGVEPMAHAMEMQNIFRRMCKARICRERKPWPTLRKRMRSVTACRRCWGSETLEQRGVTAGDNRLLFLFLRYESRDGWTG